jgi:hypothetical protein
MHCVGWEEIRSERYAEDPELRKFFVNPAKPFNTEPSQGMQHDLEFSQLLYQS